MLIEIYFVMCSFSISIHFLIFFKRAFNPVKKNSPFMPTKCSFSAIFILSSLEYLRPQRSGVVDVVVG